VIGLNPIILKSCKSWFRQNSKSSDYRMVGLTYP
jgi:hypothetical protein